MEYRRVTLPRLVGLLAGLRLKTFARGGSLLGASVPAAVGLLLAGALALGGWYLFRGLVPRSTSVWLPLALGLVTFLCGLFWVIWPVVAAQVDEAYELGRYLHYPIRPRRLYLAQTLVGLLEPSALFFYPLLLASALALAPVLRNAPVAATLLPLAFVWMSVAWGRCLQNLLLNLLTSRRSAELLFALFLALLGLAALLPPVDAAWLFARLGRFGDSVRDIELIERATRALLGTPAGWLADGWIAATRGQRGLALLAAAKMIGLGLGGWALGLFALDRFYRGSRGWRRPRARDPHDRGERRRRRAGGGAGAPLLIVARKEVRTLLGNPKARMLFAVPFFLLILLKVIGAGQLFSYLWGEAWAAVLLSLLGLYVLSVLGGQLFCNAFGYDGPGVQQVFLAPAGVGCWIAGRNLAHAGFAALQLCGLGALLFALLPGARPAGLALPLCSFLLGLGATLAAGNLLSARYPRRFHFSLARRDRPVGASFGWMAATLGAVAASSWGARAAGPLLYGLPLLGVACYGLLLPLARSWTLRQRERIIAAITRGGDSL